MVLSLIRSQHSALSNQAFIFEQILSITHVLLGNTTRDIPLRQDLVPFFSPAVIAPDMVHETIVSTRWLSHCVFFVLKKQIMVLSRDFLRCEGPGPSQSS